MEPLLFEHALAKEPGLYLWTVRYSSGGYLVTYVGETGASFGQRVKEHLIQTLGGNYRICDPESLVQGKAKVLWNGLWRKGTRDKFQEYLDRIDEFTPIIPKLLQIEAIFVAPLRDQRRLRQRVEAAIVRHIRSQPAPVSSVLPPDVRYYLRRSDEKPIKVAIECHCQVHGLPQELEA